MNKKNQKLHPFFRKAVGVSYQPDFGENSYTGSGKLQGKTALITGGDSGIGRAIAIAFAREGADMLLSYLDEHQDAAWTKSWVEQAGRKCLLAPGDIADPGHCRRIVDQAAESFGHIDVLINNAAFQTGHDAIEEISDEAWHRTMAVNVSAMFYLCRAAVPHMKPGSAIINTSSINAFHPDPKLLAYATSKGAIQSFTAGLAALLAGRKIRVNAVAPGLVQVVPMDQDKITRLSAGLPMKRPAQPAELAPVYVMLASDNASYISGTTIHVDGGKSFS